ncbi:MAG TPA: hypothetical protein VIK77_05815 [Tissierellaceae bacterium]
MNIKKLFDESKKLYGSVFWDDVELALTQDPYPFGEFGDWFFTATAMDKDGNLWDVIWYPRPDADEYDDYCDQVEDWDKPDAAEIIEEEYYLD